MSYDEQLAEQIKVNRALLDENRLLKAQVDDHECVCHECDRREEEDDQSPAEAVDVWLTRAKGLGQLTAAETAVVERLLGDLL
jgi:hypothetical protein